MVENCIFWAVFTTGCPSQTFHQEFTKAFTKFPHENIRDKVQKNKFWPYIFLWSFRKSSEQLFLIRPPGSYPCLFDYLFLWNQFVLRKGIVKMLFNSPQKLFSSSRYLSFCLDFLLMCRNDFIKKIRLISNLMTSQPG